MKAVSMIACVLTLVSLTASATSKVSLALNWKPDPEFGGFYAADDQFDLIPGGSGTPVVQMVAAGKADFGIASADEVVVARSRGADVVALFAVYQTNPQALMVHEESGFKTLGDLYASSGTLAIQKGLPYALFLEKKYAAKTHVRIVPYLGGIENFLADKTYSQQVFAHVEPLAAQKKGARVRTFLVADEGYNPYTTVLITRGDVIAKKQPLVKAVVSAARKGWRDYLDHPEKTNPHMAKLNPSMDLATFESSAKAQKSFIEPNLGAMTAQRWTELRDQLISLKLVPADEAKKDIRAYFRMD